MSEKILVCGLDTSIIRLPKIINKVVCGECEVRDRCPGTTAYLPAEPVLVLVLVRAARARVNYGHNDTCSVSLVPGTKCSCGQDALEAAIRAVEEEK